VPDFNFAKGNRKRDEETSTPAGWRQTTGQQRPVSAHPQGSASDAFSTAPERSPRHTADAAGSTDAHAGAGSDRPAGSAAGRSAPQSPRGSVLYKYPEHDLSRLTASAAAAPPVSAAPSPSAPTKPTDAPDDALLSTRIAGGSMKSSPGKGPLFAILAIVVLLILVAFLWHINPWPSLKESIAGFFGGKETESSVITAEKPEAPADVVEASELRSWDFFLQVSSWKELGRADLDAERYRTQGFDVIVESEFIPTKGGTWYRVRLGPYESSQAARDILASNAAILPKGAYVDSIRLAEDQPVAAPPRDSGPESARERGTQSRTSPSDGARTGYTTRLPGKDFSVVDEPMSGWAVKVSSLKTEDLARGEARRLLAQGYPSFITRKSIAGTIWYRVLVGPFSGKRDAERYQQLLNVTYGNDAYTIDLSAER
jgi:cell division protein FtsN